MMNYSLCNRLLVVFALLSNISLQIVVCLTYNYGDGSYYVGEVDDFGLPSGTGKFYNTSGNLGKTSTPLYSGCRAARKCFLKPCCTDFAHFEHWHFLRQHLEKLKNFDTGD